MKNKKITLKSTLVAYMYLSPMLIFTLIFNFYPIIKSFALSFYTKYNFYTDQVSAIGLDNFKYIFADPDFKKATINTLIFVVGVVPIAVILAMILALLLYRIKFLASFLKTIYFLPFVTSTVAISLVWQWIYNDQYGLLNSFLGYFNIKPINWLNDPHWAMFALIIMTIWKSLGFNIILFLAGLSNIDKRYDRVAQIDGANTWQRLRFVTIPLLSPMTFLITVNSVISGFKVFDEIYILFGGNPGPGSSALTLVFYLYRAFYTESQYGIAAAAGVVLFLIILAVTLIQFWYSKKHVHYV
ncbi:carbohydrate ABC transporter permease [Periweissella fabalis]|uniref:Sugar ABC transporter permease n=1 Tax=Periweissella fabalis TaxID=1070421 RepID=A0A7X6S3K4_9LACO|nr:sugar ABC transporter permease [Periweissella fabalis]MCM0598168.1 sugar ABC transporter permease [Periweissella fabalis]NKZ24708.1 sugar ABC transporter permease [Periweissella fabalis]